MADTETIDTAVARCGGDVPWLAEQLERWPDRVHEQRTTSIRYLDETAGAILTAASGVDDLPPSLDRTLVTRLSKAHEAFRAKHRYL